MELTDMLTDGSSLGQAGVAGILFYGFGIGNGKRDIFLPGYMTEKCICKATALGLSIEDAILLALFVCL